MNTLKTRLRWRGEQLGAAVLAGTAIGAGFLMDSWVPAGIVIAFLMIFIGSLVYYGIKHDDVLDTEGKPFTVIIPAYNDANVLEKSVESLIESTYTDFNVLIVCEYGDLPTIRKAEALSICYNQVYADINTTHPGSKAGALNHAIETTDTPYYAFFDADQIVHPSFLARASVCLEDHDIFQGRCIPEPEGIIESLGYYEVFYIVHGPKMIYQALTGKYVPRSKAIAMTADAYETVGGFDEGVLTEDIDFGTRCVEAGLSIKADHFSAPTLEEAPHRLKDWWGHRKRWLTGFMQVTRSNTQQATRGEQIKPTLALLTALLFSFLSLMLFGQVLHFLQSGQPRIIGVTLGLFALGSLGIRLYDLRTGTVDRTGAGWLLSGLFFPLIGAATVKVIMERINGKDEDWYSIEKGEIDQNLVDRITQDLATTRSELLAQMKGQADLIEANMDQLRDTITINLTDAGGTVREQMKRQKDMLALDITMVTDLSEETMIAVSDKIKETGKKWWPRETGQDE